MERLVFPVDYAGNVPSLIHENIRVVEVSVNKNTVKKRRRGRIG